MVSQPEQLTENLKLLLIGAGHAQLAVLADWIENGAVDCEATLINPSPHLRYSGTLPGWISGAYPVGEGLVDAKVLARCAGVKFVEARIVAIDADMKMVTLDNSEALAFDICSIDTGGVGQAEEVLGADPRLLDIRPIGEFVKRWSALRDASGMLRNVAVVGGGAGGVELAFAIRNAASMADRPEVSLITGRDGLLPDLHQNVRTIISDELERQRIEIITSDAVFENGRLTVDGKPLKQNSPFDVVVAAIGSGAPQWPCEGGLATDSEGFIAVDKYQRSMSHPYILAAGDVAARQDRDVPHAGVHAVYTGPVLAENLRAIIAGQEPAKSYSPRMMNLYLIGTGQRSAILSYGPLALKGRWLWRLKQWIDRRWLRSYAKLAGKT